MKKKKAETLSHIEHEGYTVVQASNFHISVYKDGRMILHSSCKRKMSEDELKDHVDFVRKIRSKR